MHKLGCVYVLITIGVLLFTTTTAQDCPPPGDGFGLCVEACNSTSCSNGQLCCSNGCGRECMTPVVDPCATVRCAAPSCHDLSPGTITPEGECCPVCACTATDGSMVAAGTSFMNDCNTCSCGSTGVAFCTLIACPPTTEPTTPTPPSTATSTTTTTTADTSTLPTTSTPMMCPNVTGLIGQCYEGCSSDDQCSNGQMCCSNGCGHTCMDPVPNCASVSCLRPNCESPSVLVTPEGSCCPVCGCQGPNGDGIAPGESYQPDSCNTCTCFQNGLAACTLAFCPPPTDSTPTTDGPTPNCPVGGQVQVECASPCSITCANMDSVLICPTVCVTNGCQCPRGTVIDEQSNTCVPPSACSSATPPQPSGCTASDGTSVGVGETYMDQCNTCRCLEGGVGACTRKACIGCTLADGSWVSIGDTYQKDCNTCTCTGRGVDICTEKACIGVNPGAGNPDILDGSGGGATVFAGLITTLLCGLLSVFFQLL